MDPLASQRIPASSLSLHIRRIGAQYMAGRSNSVRHIYYSRRLRRWVAVSNAGNGYVQVNQYAECPCGATS